MRFILIGLALALAGCTTQSVTQSYRPAGSTAAPWAINGTISELGEHTVTVNGRVAISGKVSMLDGRGTIHGTYEGHAMRSECDAVSRGQRFPTCRVYVDNELAATLTF